MTRPDVITGPGQLTGQLPRAHLRWIIFRSAGYAGSIPVARPMKVEFTGVFRSASDVPGGSGGPAAADQAGADGGAAAGAWGLRAGGRAGYVQAKCRCQGCRQWARDYGRERMRVRLAASGEVGRRWEKSRDADEAYLDEPMWNRIWVRAAADSGIPFKPTAYQLRRARLLADRRRGEPEGGDAPARPGRPADHRAIRACARRNRGGRPPGGSKGYCRLCEHRPRSALSPLTNSRDDAR
jgi:hypothetical protein